MLLKHALFWCVRHKAILWFRKTPGPSMQDVVCNPVKERRWESFLEEICGVPVSQVSPFSLPVMGIEDRNWNFFRWICTVLDVRWTDVRTGDIRPKGSNTGGSRVFLFFFYFKSFDVLWISSWKPDLATAPARWLVLFILLVWKFLERYTILGVIEFSVCSLGLIHLQIHEWLSFHPQEYWHAFSWGR